ncbi:MAG: PLP-dependent aminotransferase family protein [Chloroflexi bacterium]|nr:PLP-dependent aminotransferase family protein [Chloroflexota bacterium]
MVSREEDVAAAAARLWADRDPEALLSSGARELSPGTATDWGLPASAWELASRGEAISLAGGIPDPSTLPAAALREALDHALASDDGGALTYGGGLGFEGLREQLADRSARELGLPASAEHFMLTNGSAGGIAIVCAALLDRGDIVVSESPTFSGTMRTLRGHGARIVTVPVDEDGCRTDALAATLARLQAEGRRAKLVYAIPNFHNPTGASLTLERRRELVRLAAEHGALLLDDDPYGEIHFDEARPPSLAALAGGRGVITVGTFSKTIATGLRVGWIEAEPELIERFTRMRFDMGGSPLLHRMIAGFIESGGYGDHVGRMRPLYARKAEALQRGLRQYAEPYAEFRGPRGGFFLWVRLRDGLSTDAVQREALAEGVVFPVGRAFFPDHAERDDDPGSDYIRLAFSTASVEELEEAAARIARACERAAGG